MPLSTLVMTSAPNSALVTLPRPPNRLVPPMTAAAMALSSSPPPPTLGSTDCSRLAPTMPPSAAMPPAITNTAVRIRSTGMPARRAASAFPPIA